MNVVQNQAGLNPLGEKSEALRSDPPQTVHQVNNGRSWLIHPAVDLLFLVNILWPLMFFAGFANHLNGQSSLQFWQIYFVTTPHRWITLWLVFADSKRYAERSRVFLMVMAAIVLSCLFVRVTTGALTCLLAIDYIWNAWHFAAQHHGIYRLYERRANPEPGLGRLHKWLFRLSLLYVIFRVAGWSWQFETLDESLHQFDYLVAGSLAVLSAWDWALHTPRSWGRSLYVTSVALLFVSLLAAVHYQRPDMVLALSTASALFHATEYLAIVSWNIHDRSRKQNVGGLMLRIAPIWLLFLGAFAVALGVGSWWIDQRWVNFWLMINVMVAFLHYSYDGLIWRKPRGKPV